MVPKKHMRLPDEAQLKSMEEKGEHAVEMEKEEDAPQEEGSQEAEVSLSSNGLNALRSD